MARKVTVQGLLVTDLAHLSRQLTELTLLLAHLCLLFILLSFITADHIVPYHGAKIAVSNAKGHTRMLKPAAGPTVGDGD